MNTLTGSLWHEVFQEEQNSNFMEYILIGIVLVFIIILLLLIKKFFFKKGESFQKVASSSSKTVFAKCPVCSSFLTPGKNIRSKVFRTTSENDQLCYVYGCSDCYPKCPQNLSRSCPVCHKSIPQDGYLISRLFNKTKSGMPHVIINGCINCNKH